MYIYSSLYIGDYFIFLLSAQDTHPVKIFFKDHETTVKGKKSQYPLKFPFKFQWKEKVYLSPALLQRKWMDYKFKDRFIPSVKYDNVLPLGLTYSFLNRVATSTEIKLRTDDKNYKNVHIQIMDEQGEVVYKKLIPYITVKRESVINFSLSKPGSYRIALSADDRLYLKSPLLFYQKRYVIDHKNFYESDYRHLLTSLIQGIQHFSLYCSFCRTRFYPVEPDVVQDYIHKNYIPLKEYLDIEGLGIDFISKFIMKINHPSQYKRGLIHLLNMLRLSSLSDELTIVTNLFKDDPPFAYFITDKLFLFKMIPVMEDRELQRIFNKIDDTLLADALAGEDQALVSKVMRNVSKRRAQSILKEIREKSNKDENSEARAEIHRRIKSYFEERFGRELKIPYSSKVVYRVKKLNELFINGSHNTLFYHTGSFIFFNGSEIYEFPAARKAPAESQKSNSRAVKDTPLLPFSSSNQIGECIKYDFETCRDNIFNVVGISESTVYLLSLFGIQYALIHIYNWVSSLEDFETVENISRYSVVPLRLPSSSFILTIGAIDGRGRPFEQIIRLKIKESPT